MFSYFISFHQILIYYDIIYQVFLHLERDEDEAETNTVMENLSRSMLRNRAMSRSLSIPSKSTSYHSLQNEAAASTVTTDSEINTGMFCFVHKGRFVLLKELRTVRGML